MSSIDITFPFDDLNELEPFDLLNTIAPSLDSFDHLYFIPPVFNDADVVDDSEHLFFNETFNNDSTYFNFDDALEQKLGKDRNCCLSLVSINIRSVPKNSEVFFADFHRYNLDVVGMCETRLNADLEALYSIQNYNTFFSSRDTNGGGVLLHVRNQFKPNKIVSLSIKSPFIESVFVEMTVDGKKRIVGNIYRPPNSDIVSFLSKLYEILVIIMQLKRECPVFIMGDFNMDLLKLNTNVRYIEYFKLMSSFGYFPLIRRPTRVTLDSKTLIDHLWTTEPSDVVDSGIILYDLSDHFPIFTCVKRSYADSNVDDRYVVFKRRINNDTCDSVFRERLSTVDWSILQFSPSVDEMYETFSNIISEAYDYAYPLTEVRRKKVDLIKPYINADVKNLIKEKHRVQRLFRLYPYTYSGQYKRIRNKVNKAVAKAKRNYFSSKLNSCAGDQKKTWSVLGEALGRAQKNLVDVFVVHEREITDCKSIAEQQQILLLLMIGFKSF